MRVLLALLATLLACAAVADAATACGYRRHAGGQHHPAALVIGDSTSIFAVPLLARRGLEADAQECRQWADGAAMVAQRRRTHRLPHLVVLALGANGPVTRADIAGVLHTIGRRHVLGLVTPRNLASSARAMRRAARRRPRRVLLIDWSAHSAGHTAWFASDGLHVDQGGAAAFARFIARRARTAEQR